MVWCWHSLRGGGTSWCGGSTVWGVRANHGAVVAQFGGWGTSWCGGSTVWGVGAHHGVVVAHFWGVGAHHGVVVAHSSIYVLVSST